MKLSPVANYQIGSKKSFARQNNYISFLKNNETDSFSSVEKTPENQRNTRQRQIVRAWQYLIIRNPDIYSYQTFIAVSKNNGINTLEDLVANIKPENLIGAGANSRVYKFDNDKLERWVIKEDLKPFRKKTNGLFEPVKDEFEKHNVGQEIAKAGDRYKILKKINGVPHSVPDWSYKINDGSNVSREEALEFLNSLNIIQDFPQSSYDDYASDIKMIGQKGYKQDSINPNNILIDYENQKIQVIDFFKKADPSHVDSKYDLYSVLLDFSLFSYFYEKLNEDEQKQLTDCAKTIIEKCTIASKKSGIKQSEKIYLAYLANVDKWFGEFLLDKGGDYRTRYKRMKAILQKADESDKS